MAPPVQSSLAPPSRVIQLQDKSAFAIIMTGEDLFQDGETHLEEKDFEAAAKLFFIGAEKNHPGCKEKINSIQWPKEAKQAIGALCFTNAMENVNNQIKCANYLLKGISFEHNQCQLMLDQVIPWSSKACLHIANYYKEKDPKKAHSWLEKAKQKPPSLADLGKKA